MMAQKVFTLHSFSFSGVFKMPARLKNSSKEMISNFTLSKLANEKLRKELVLQELESQKKRKFHEYETEEQMMQGKGKTRNQQGEETDLRTNYINDVNRILEAENNSYHDFRSAMMSLVTNYSSLRAFLHNFFACKGIAIKKHLVDKVYFAVKNLYQNPQFFDEQYLASRVSTDDAGNIHFNEIKSRVKPWEYSLNGTDADLEAETLLKNDLNNLFNEYLSQYKAELRDSKIYHDNKTLNSHQAQKVINNFADFLTNKVENFQNRPEEPQNYSSPAAGR